MIGTTFRRRWDALVERTCGAIRLDLRRMSMCGIVVIFINLMISRRVGVLAAWGLAGDRTLGLRSPCL